MIRTNDNNYHHGVCIASKSLFCKVNISDDPCACNLTSPFVIFLRKHQQLCNTDNMTTCLLNVKDPI